MSLALGALNKNYFLFSLFLMITYMYKIAMRLTKEILGPKAPSLTIDLYLY